MSIGQELVAGHFLQADADTENWCGVLQEVVLPCDPEPSKFLEAAVFYANDRCIQALWLSHRSSFYIVRQPEPKLISASALRRCWGSLSCTVISPPETDADALDKAVAGLRYGSVCVNAPSFVGYSFPKLSWGAFPGNNPQVKSFSSDCLDQSAGCRLCECACFHTKQSTSLTVVTCLDRK